MDNRQIDALVAEKVMGWGIHKRNTAFWVKSDRVNEVEVRPIAFIHEWQPSTDISAAWQVVEKLHKDGMKFSISSFYQANIWYASFLLVDGKRVVEAKEDSSTLAICLAALKAVGVEIEDTKSSM